jgi:hypothetical protein
LTGAAENSIGSLGDRRLATRKWVGGEN